MKVSEKRILILIVSVVFLFSCSQNKSTDKRDSGDAGNFFSSIFSASHSEYLSPDEMMKYVINSDNGLLKSKKINEYTYSVKYKPVPYIISREANSNEISKEEFVNRSEKLDGMQYFDLRLEVSNTSNEILKYNLSSESEYDSRLNYLAFQMQNDIKLVEGNDTLDCLLYHLERAYDIVPYSTVLLGFKNLKQDIINDKVIVFQDKLFNNGTIKLTFLKSDLELIPKLKM